MERKFQNPSIQGTKRKILSNPTKIMKTGAKDLCIITTEKSSVINTDFSLKICKNVLDKGTDCRASIQQIDILSRVCFHSEFDSKS